MLNICKKNSIEVGIDEVARGCMFGRVYSAGVIWPIDYMEESYYKIMDSKKLILKKNVKNYIII